MTTIAPSAIEAQAEYTSMLEAERQSFADDLAAMTQRAEAAEAELRRIKAAYPDVV